jgi:hypothetical protein
LPRAPKSGGAACLFRCLVSVALLAASASAGSADTDTLSAEQTLLFERAPAYTDDEDPFALQGPLEYRGVSETVLTYTKKRDRGDQFILEQGIKVELYPEVEQFDRYRLRTRGEYWTYLDDDRSLQLRLQAENTYVRDRWQATFNRFWVGTQLRYRHGPENTTYANVRYGYRDQNEETFKGFDQSEFLMWIGHDWRPFRDRLLFSATAYADFHDAEFERFSYEQYGARLRVRYPVTENLELTARADIYTRGYNDVFSALIPIVRGDNRLYATLQADYRLTDNAVAFGYVGWDGNSSSIDLRGYSGMVFGLGITVAGDIWSSDR